ncbi:MAG: hypothetical protein EXS03_00400 [Phycisphaerales bacterium]|nr:hypothetical protein [Phycisphaerales bacterium]
MGDASSKAKIKDTLRVLHVQWSQIQQEWRDQACEGITREAVDPADDAARIALLALDELGEAIARARRECGA